MKPSLVVAIALALCVYFAPRSEGQDRAAAKAQKTASQNSEEAAVPIPYQIQNQWVEGDTGNGGKESPPWYKSPEWVLVIVGIVTAWVIGWQSFETRRAARATSISAAASQRSVEILINSERAWVVAAIGDLPDFKPDREDIVIRWIRPKFKNHGKTPARVTRIRGVVKLVPFGDFLPPIPEYPVGQGFDETSDWVLTPGNTMRPRLSISISELEAVRKSAATLYVYGSIEYVDIGEHQRLSSWCFAYLEEDGYAFTKSGFYPVTGISGAYTKCN